MGNKLCGDRPNLSSDIDFQAMLEAKYLKNSENKTGVNAGNTVQTSQELETTNIDTAKIQFIQSEWRKKKEKEKVVERIRVLEKDLCSLGRTITIEEMKSRTKPEILKVQKDLSVYEGKTMDNEKLEEKLIFRRPFLFNYDNSVYHGFWGETGLREGYGVHVKESGTLEEGLWREGRLFKGRIFDLEGNYYEGDIQDGMPHGVGAKYGQDKSVFTGQWKNGKQFLLGERIYHNGFKFNGIFSESRYNGKGKFVYPDGCSFEGEFTQSSFKGYGKFKHVNGDTFEGTWYNNLPNGKGVYNFNSANLGHKYDGEYRNGRKEGTGKYSFKADSFYTGEWSNGYPNGNGEYKLGDTSYKGFWRYGQLINLIEGKGKNLDISIKTEKEQFKLKHENEHLIDEIDGKITNPPKYAKSYHPSIGSDLLNKIIKQ
jgi:hypothetical protein